MNLFKIHHHQSIHFHCPIPKTTIPSSFSNPKTKSDRSVYSLSISALPPTSGCRFRSRSSVINRLRVVTCSSPAFHSPGSSGLEKDDDVADDVYKETLRLVECAMLAAVSALTYFLSNSLAIEVLLLSLSFLCFHFWFWTFLFCRIILGVFLHCPLYWHPWDGALLPGGRLWLVNFTVLMLHNCAFVFLFLLLLL